MQTTGHVPYTVDELKQTIECEFRAKPSGNGMVHASSIFHHLVTEYSVKFSTLTDYAAMKFIYVSECIEQVLGYPCCTVAAGGLEFMFGLLHPDEMNSLRLIHKQIVAFFVSLPQEDKLRCSYAYDMQLRKADGTYTRMLCQLDAMEVDKHGHLRLGKETYTDISALHEYPKMKLVISIHDDAGGKEVLAHHFSEHLTKREKEIDELANQGMVSKEIGEKLCLSKHTVDTYRRRIRKKGR